MVHVVRAESHALGNGSGRTRSHRQSIQNQLAEGRVATFTSETEASLHVALGGSGGQYDPCPFLFNQVAKEFLAGLCALRRLQQPDLGFLAIRSGHSDNGASPIRWVRQHCECIGVQVLQPNQPIGGDVFAPLLQPRAGGHNLGVHRIYRLADQFHRRGLVEVVRVAAKQLVGRVSMLVRIFLKSALHRLHLDVEVVFSGIFFGIEAFFQNRRGLLHFMRQHAIQFFRQEMQFNWNQRVLLKLVAGIHLMVGAANTPWLG